MEYLAITISAVCESSAIKHCIRKAIPLFGMCTVAFRSRLLWIGSKILSLFLENATFWLLLVLRLSKKCADLTSGLCVPFMKDWKYNVSRSPTHHPSDPGKGSCCHQLIVHQVPSVWWKCPIKAVSLYPPLTLLTMTNNWMRSGFNLYLLLASISSLVGSSDDSSLFEASRALSSSYWEQYRTLSQPADDLMQCLARCELHENNPDYSG